MTRLGDRRRLSMDLQRLTNKQGFRPASGDQPGALSWSADDVERWLGDQKVPTTKFKEHAVDGACLLGLQRDDLVTLGLSTLGDKALLMKKLDALKKQTYAGQTISAGDSSGAISDTSSSANGGADLRAVLEAVLEENSNLRGKIGATQKRLQTQPSDVPEQYVCPILMEVSVRAGEGVVILILKPVDAGVCVTGPEPEDVLRVCTITRV